DEVGDHFDGALDVEILQGAIEQISRNRGDAVALFNGIAGDGKETAVVAHEGDVSAMKSGDERKTARSGHGTCQQGADGVGNGIVNVKEVKRFFLEDLEHFRGEGEGVRRMIEQRIGDYGGLVKMNVGIILIHANGRGIGNKMDVVPAGGKLLAKFGCNDAGAAVCRIAGDADSHSEALKFLWCATALPLTGRCCALARVAGQKVAYHIA